MNKEQIINYLIETISNYNETARRYNNTIKTNNCIARNHPVKILTTMDERDYLQVTEESFKDIAAVVGNEVITIERKSDYCPYEHKMYFTDDWYICYISDNAECNLDV